MSIKCLKNHFLHKLSSFLFYTHIYNHNIKMCFLKRYELLKNLTKFPKKCINFFKNAIASHCFLSYGIGQWFLISTDILTFSEFLKIKLPSNDSLLDLSRKILQTMNRLFKNHKQNPLLLLPLERCHKYQDTFIEKG